MSTRKIFNIVNICLAVFVIINMFLPFAAGYYGDVSFWDADGDKHILPIILMLEMIGACVVYVMHVVGSTKETKNAYPLVGFGATYYLYLFIGIMANGGSFDSVKIGFWLGLISTVALVVTTILANYMSDEAPVKPQYGGYGGYNQNQYGYGAPQGNGYYPNNQMNGPQQGYNGQNGPMYR